LALNKGYEMTKTYEYTAGSQMFWSEKLDNVRATEEHCTLCARKLGKNFLMVEVHNGGDLVAKGFAVEDSGYMGAWPVGSECAKKFSPELLTQTTR